MRVNPVGKPLSEVELAYLAGFIDGDGAIMVTLERHAEKKFRFRIRATVKITQQSKANVAWLPSATGIGYVRSNRTTHEWIVRDQQAIRSFLERIVPYLRCKKKQAEMTLVILNRAILTVDDLREIARLADALSAFNVRSRNRRKNFAAMIKVSGSPND